MDLYSSSQLISEKDVLWWHNGRWMDYLQINSWNDDTTHTKRIWGKRYQLHKGLLGRAGQAQAGPGWLEWGKESSWNFIVAVCGPGEKCLHTGCGFERSEFPAGICLAIGQTRKTGVAWKHQKWSQTLNYSCRDNLV